MKFGIIKERKTPPDRRVALSPQACKAILKRFPQVSLKVESSAVRVFPDDEYRATGIPVTTDVSDCDVLLGIKEVPIEALIPGKKYFFFSHTIKKQPYNRALLQAILEKNIELYDYETLTKPDGQRLIAFGKYAGIVGAYNGFRAYGLKYKLFTLPKAENLPHQKALLAELKAVSLPPIKILLTGRGRVGAGVREVLDGMGIKKVTTHAYLHEKFIEPVYCQIDVLEYNRHQDGKRHTKEHFYKNPEEYQSNFIRFAYETDFYIAGHFYKKGSPVFFTKDDVKSPRFRIKVIADISCDMQGPIPCTLRSSTIAEPVYGYDPLTGQETDYRKPEAIAIMAVDNLPCELPRDASEGFGAMLLKHLLPAFFNGDKDGILARAKITENGKLTARYAYLQAYVEGRE